MASRFGGQGLSGPYGDEPTKKKDVRWIPAFAGMTLSLGMKFHTRRSLLLGTTGLSGRTLFSGTTEVVKKKEGLNNYMAARQSTIDLSWGRFYNGFVEKKWGGVEPCFTSYFKYLFHYLYPFKIKLPAFSPGVATCWTPAFAGVTGLQAGAAEL